MRTTMSKEKVSSYQQRLNEIAELKRKNRELKEINDRVMRAVEVLNKCCAEYRSIIERDNNELVEKFEELFKEMREDE